MMQLQKTNIPGCYQLNPINFTDERGTLIKTFHQQEFTQKGLKTNFVENYYSVSNHRVLRGLHFQVPPMDNTKLIYCVSGKVMDVVVDLRIGSPTYGQYEIFQLDSANASMIYIPPGLAHGFYVESNLAIMVYLASSMYSPQHDTGIRWNSLSIPWPDSHPIVSKKDRELPCFVDFVSPFRYDESN